MHRQQVVGNEPAALLERLAVMFQRQEQVLAPQTEVEEREVEAADLALDGGQPGHVEGLEELANDVQDQDVFDVAVVEQTLFEALVDDERPPHDGT